MEGFYFVAHHEYDHVLEVEHSKREELLVGFGRDIAPGIIKIFDFGMIAKGNTTHQLKIISLFSDDFIIDVATFNSSKISYSQFQHKPIGSFCLSWPYLSFVSMNRFLIIWNIFENKTIHVVEIGDVDSNLFIEDTFIT